MSSPKTCAKSSSSSFPPPHIFGAGVDQHAIEIHSKLHPYTQKNLDENFWRICTKISTALLWTTPKHLSSRCILDYSNLAASVLSRTEVSRHSYA
ncbi:unnamed protein product [Prunus brigantina]